MKRTLYIVSGLSVLVTTLTYGHTMYRTNGAPGHTSRPGVQPFFAVHAILAAATGVLSLIFF